MTTSTQTKSFRQQVEEALPDKTKGMGDTQWAFLQALVDHGYWSKGAGWTWENRSTSERLARSMESRGLVQQRMVYASRHFVPVTPVNDIWNAIKSARDAARSQAWRQKSEEQEHEAKVRQARESAVADLKDRHMDEFNALLVSHLSRLGLS